MKFDLLNKTMSWSLPTQTRNSCLRSQNGRSVRSADLHTPKMLQKLRMAGLVKPLRIADNHRGWPDWANRVVHDLKL